MLTNLKKYIRRPELFEKSSSKFWDDAHISKGMLEAHLHPTWDAASRNHVFVDRSADWIARVLPPEQYPRLVDLGCGPGLYAERFHQRGYRVTGVDISKRSLDYARERAYENGHAIEYLNQSYLDLTLEEAFDCAVIIYCDYGALSEGDRRKFLTNVYRALRPGGRLLLDAFTPMYEKERANSTDWSYQDGGFWSADPHLSLNSFYRYDDSNTTLSQTIVVTENAVECYNIWNQKFTPETLQKELLSCGFTGMEIYGDVAGACYSPDSPTICAIVRKDG